MAKKIDTTKSTQFDNIKHLMDRTWDGTAPDVLGAEEDGVSMRRSEVICVVLDQIAYSDKVPKEEMDAWMALTSNKRKAIAKEVFTYSHYGW